MPRGTEEDDIYEFLLAAENEPPDMSGEIALPDGRRALLDHNGDFHSVVGPAILSEKHEENEWYFRGERIYYPRALGYENTPAWSSATTSKILLQIEKLPQSSRLQEIRQGLLSRERADVLWARSALDLYVLDNLSEAAPLLDLDPDWEEILWQSTQERWLTLFSAHEPREARNLREKISSLSKKRAEKIMMLQGVIACSRNRPSSLWERACRSTEERAHLLAAEITGKQSSQTFLFLPSARWQQDLISPAEGIIALSPENDPDPAYPANRDNLAALLCREILRADLEPLPEADHLAVCAALSLPCFKDALAAEELADSWIQTHPGLEDLLSEYNSPEACLADLRQKIRS